MQPREFLELAKELADKSGVSAAELRTALGRAYYAVYNSGVECQKNFGYGFFTGRDSGKNHSLVRDRFGEILVEDGRQLYTDMKELQKKRHDADYDLANSSVESIATVKLHVALAEETLTLIESFSSHSQSNDIARELGDLDKRKGFNL